MFIKLSQTSLSFGEQSKAPFTLSRFKVPVHPGDEPCHNRGGTVDSLGDPG